MRRYSKINTEPDPVENAIMGIEESLGVNIDCVIEQDENGIYPVIKFTTK